MWPFKRKADEPSGFPDLVFKGPIGFFKYQCKYGQTEIVPNRAIVAIIVDAAKEFGVLEAVHRRQDGVQVAVINVVSPGGGFTTLATTPSEEGDNLQVNDLVMWVPGAWNRELAEGLGDPRRGWVGLIRAKIAPKFTSDGFQIIGRFD